MYEGLRVHQLLQPYCTWLAWVSVRRRTRCSDYPVASSFCSLASCVGGLGFPWCGHRGSLACSRTLGNNSERTSHDGATGGAFSRPVRRTSRTGHSCLPTERTVPFFPLNLNNWSGV